MTDKNLVNDIYYKLGDYQGDIVPENNEILGRILENIKTYGNSSIDEIDSKYSWVKIQSPHINSLKFINTKGYAKYLKKVEEIDRLNKLGVAKDIYNFLNYKGPRPIIYHKYIDTPQPWDNYLILKAYRCLLTKSIGFTYYVKNTYMIKPFNIIKHNWELIQVVNKGIEYICKDCNIAGFKHKGMPSGEIFPVSDFMLSCNEHMIKKLLE